jgi:hypothetical protein
VLAAFDITDNITGDITGDISCLPNGPDAMQHVIDKKPD